MDAPPRRMSNVGFLALQVLLVVLAVAAFLGIRWLGESVPVLSATALPPQAPAHAAFASFLPAILASLAAILLAARILATIARRLGQPPVIGEILAGIALGPSLLGALWPEASAIVLSDTALPFLGRLADLGVILFMFLVGLEFDPGQLRGRGRTAMAVSVAGTAFPFLAGAILALWLHSTHGASGISYTVFALFLGTAMSVTAFPVLARILADLGLARTDLGALALSSAAVSDVLAWCLLAVVVGFESHHSDGIATTLGFSALFVAGMLLIGRPLIRWLAARLGAATEPGDYALMVALALMAALITELIGIHPLFGAFLFGVLVPHDSAVAVEARRHMETLVIGLFLPVFFAWSGLRTQIGLVDGLSQWGVCLAIIAVAFASKAGGTWLAARATGMGPRDATALGTLMNTRGLVELVVLNVGLDLGVITPTLFSMLVLMAVTTTLATAPILRLVLGSRRMSLEFPSR
jgi:Kef-type K+ transport system membrane component KefB